MAWDKNTLTVMLTIQPVSRKRAFPVTITGIGQSVASHGYPCGLIDDDAEFIANDRIAARARLLAIIDGLFKEPE